jgi:hypothetical protein
LSSYPLAAVKHVMSSNAGKTKHGSRVLHPSGRKQQARADSADLRPDRMACHFPHPVRVADFGIVVQQKQNFAGCFAGRSVVDCRVVERSWTGQDAKPRIT